jgi:Mg2+-importing ATPase
MAVVGEAKNRSGGDTLAMELAAAAGLPALEVLAQLGSAVTGLSSDEGRRRLGVHGPNALRGHGARPWRVLVRQLENPLLLLLVGAALSSLFVGERVDAVIILAIICLSVGLGFVNEYRSERALERLHSRIKHHAVAVRGGELCRVDVTDLVPGDVVLLDVGDIVPADLRLLEVHGLECDEAVLTGESLPSSKTMQPAAEAGLHLPSCAFMGTVVRAGTGHAVVVATEPTIAFGRIASALGQSAVETGFQRGLRRFSGLLARVTVGLAVSIFVINWALHRLLIESALFALAIAVGLTPQLLPAIVTLSLSYGADWLAWRSVLVKQLLAIEDLGNIEVLFTDKTSTLTEGRLTLAALLDGAGRPSEAVLRIGRLCSSAAVEAGMVVGGNPLDRAVWEAAPGGPAFGAGFDWIGQAPFDYDRRLMSVLVQSPDGRELIVKGAPEAVLQRCASVSPDAAAALEEQFAAGARVIAVGIRVAPDLAAVGPEDERDLDPAGFLVFTHPIKSDAAESLAQLDRLGVRVKIVTGDNERVAQQACHALGLPVDGTMTGADLDCTTTKGWPSGCPRPRSSLASAPSRRHASSRPSADLESMWPSWGRRQRRRGSSRRRRGDLGRGGNGRGPRGGRRRAAGEGPRRPRRGRHRGPPDLRQHGQVRPDGDLV